VKSHGTGIKPARRFRLGGQSQRLDHLARGDLKDPDAPILATNGDSLGIPADNPSVGRLFQEELACCGVVDAYCRRVAVPVEASLHELARRPKGRPLALLQPNARRAELSSEFLVEDD
jgi:hypothetical protein